MLIHVDAYLLSVENKFFLIFYHYEFLTQGFLIYYGHLFEFPIFYWDSIVFSLLLLWFFIEVFQLFCCVHTQEQALKFLKVQHINTTMTAISKELELSTLSIKVRQFRNNNHQLVVSYQDWESCKKINQKLQDRLLSQSKRDHSHTFFSQPNICCINK